MTKKIAFISQPEYFSFVYDGGISGYETKEFPFNFEMKSEELQDLIEYKADYNVFFRGEYVPNEVLQRIKGIKIALSSEPFPRKIRGKYVYTKDSIKRYLDFRKRIRGKEFDYVFHYDETSLDLFKKDGLVISGEFVLPVSSKVFKPLKLQKNKDFFFLGRSTPHREGFFGHLKHHYNFLHIAHGIYDGNEFNRLANESRINLNIHAENEVSWEPRLQILLASGAFVISEKISPNKYLEPGKDYIEVGGPSAMFDLATGYLSKPKERKQITENAKLKIDKFFNSDRVFSSFLDNIEKGVFQKYTSQKRGNTLFDFLERIL